MRGIRSGFCALCDVNSVLSLSPEIFSLIYIVLSLFVP